MQVLQSIGENDVFVLLYSLCLLSSLLTSSLGSGNEECRTLWDLR